MQTIEPFLGSFEKRPRIIREPLTIERNLGEFTGTQKGTFTKYCEENDFDKISCKPKNGESIVEIYERANKFLSLLRKRYRDEKILICGHQIFLNCLQLVLSGKALEDYYSIKPLENGEIKEFSNSGE